MRNLVKDWPDSIAAPVGVEAAQQVSPSVKMEHEDHLLRPYISVGEETKQAIMEVWDQVRNEFEDLKDRTLELKAVAERSGMSDAELQLRKRELAAKLGEVLTKLDELSPDADANPYSEQARRLIKQLMEAGQLPELVIPDKVVA